MVQRHAGFFELASLATLAKPALLPLVMCVYLLCALLAVCGSICVAAHAPSHAPSNRLLLRSPAAALVGSWVEGVPAPGLRALCAVSLMRFAVWNLQSSDLTPCPSV